MRRVCFLSSLRDGKDSRLKNYLHRIQQVTAKKFKKLRDERNSSVKSLKYNF